MAVHSHDNMDWDTQLQRLRERDELRAPETAELAGELLRPGDRVVVDIGAGAGGSAAAFAESLAGSGGAVTIVDSAPELLSEAVARAQRSAGPGVEVRSATVDAASDELVDAVRSINGGGADLVFASFFVHHLPDQLAGLRRLAELLAPGGQLAVWEAGLEPRVLPWDVGFAEPGLEGRLVAARGEWFRGMREEIPGSVRLPVGWSEALSQAGLEEVRSWSSLIDRPAPVSGVALSAVLGHLEWLREDAEQRVSDDDVRAIDALLDPESPQHAEKRRDLGYLRADTVHVGTRPRT
jgi:SAM-dependent methyltransferase